MRRCDCGSYAVNDDPDKVVCDVCFQKRRVRQLSEENAKLREAMAKYADHSMWCCLDHNVVGCEFCPQTDFIVRDGDDFETPGWKVAEDALKENVSE